MSELKAHEFCDSDEFFREYPGPLSNEMRPYYLKSEADKVIAKKDEEIDELKESIDELQKATDSAWSKVNAMYDELRHQKYKRCLGNAAWCKDKMQHYMYDDKVILYGFRFYERWYKCWLEIAKKFKEAHDAEV